MAEPKSNQVKIGDKTYDLSTMSDEARAELASLRATEMEIARLTAQLAIFKTARNAYAVTLRQLLDKNG